MRSTLGAGKHKFAGKSVMQILEEFRGPVELP
jgi:hypothetical protein